MDEALNDTPRDLNAGECTDDWASLDRLRGKKWAAEMLRRRKMLVNVVAVSQEATAAAKRIEAQKVKDLDAFDEQLEPRMRNRRPLLLRRFHSVIRTPDGEIRIFSKKKVLDLEGVNTQELIEELDNNRIGRAAVRTKKELDKEAVKQLSPRFIRNLSRRLSKGEVWLGQMFYVSVKSSGEKVATNIVRQHRRK